jgi:S1-C subfamily serine protease
LKRYYLWILVGGAAIILSGLGRLVWSMESKDYFQSQGVENNNLGFSYLNVNSKTSSYYNLDGYEGALITEVIPDGLADKAGIKKGDLVISYNGVKVSNEDSLYGIQKKCASQNNLMIEVIRNNKSQLVEIIKVPAAPLPPAN